MEWVMLSGSVRNLVLFCCVWAAPAGAQENVTRFSTLDRYDPTQLAIQTDGVPGEHIDLRTLGVSWEVEDFVVPGNGGLDIVVSRSFNKLSHTPSDMGHWYFGLPRIQIPTSPWRAPYDPALASQSTYNAAWNNLYARLNYGASSICTRAGNLVDSTTTASLTRLPRSGIFFAAPIVLSIPGEGTKVLLEKRGDADQFPATARYVTTDNWYATCLAPASGRIWGGFVVVSPDGRRFTFDFIKYLVPGDYGTHSAGGWVEMGISTIRDVHGNRIDYHYDLDPGGTALLDRIDASDGRLITLDWYPGSVRGVDVEGSPLSLLSAVNIHADGDVHTIRYEYCDFSDYYILGSGCEPIELGPDRDLPVLHQVIQPDGDRTSYRYHPSMYTANALFDWGNFEFLLQQIQLPTGGLIEYDYDDGYSPILSYTDSPAPRLAARRILGRDVAPGNWSFSYSIDQHIERSTVTGPRREDVYEFYEGLGTYEFLIARYPGQHTWPGNAPTDYDELMGQLRSQRTYDASSGELLRQVDYEYAMLPFIGEQYYGGNWLGSPTLVLAQIRPRPVAERRVTNYLSAPSPLTYITSTSPDQFDAFGFPRIIDESGYDGSGSPQSRRTEISWLHELPGTSGWFIGLPTLESTADRLVRREYFAGLGLPRLVDIEGIITRFEFHPDGNLAAEIWQQSGAEYRREHESYHRGIAQRIAEPIGTTALDYAVWQRSVDDLGRIVAVTNPLGDTTAFGYDSAGRLLLVAEPLTEPLGYDYRFDEFGLLAEVVGQQGYRRQTTTLDGFGRALATRDEDTTTGEVRAIDRRYDSSGLLAFESIPYFHGIGADVHGIEYSYDALGRVTTEFATSDGTSLSYCYVSDCLPPSYVATYGPLANGYARFDQNGSSVIVQRSAYGDPDNALIARLTEQYSASSAPAQYRSTVIERDENGRPTRALREGPGEISIERLFEYDGSRVSAEVHPETGRTEYRYDERGNRLQVLTELRTVQRRFDGQGRVLAIDYDGSAHDVSFAYDALGNLIRADNQGSEWLYSYDGAGRLVVEELRIDGESFPFVYAYDSVGYRLSMAYPSGETVDFSTNAFGEPIRVGEVVDLASRHADGALSGLHYGNGVVAHYPQSSRLLPLERTYTDPGGQLLEGYRYAYDDVGNILRMENLRLPERSLTAGYDGIGRLISADGYWGVGSLSYDIHDNILSKDMGNYSLRYSYDGEVNRLVAVDAGGATPFPIDHDAEGKMLGSGFYSYEYNSAAQLSRVPELPGLGFRYDAHGRLAAIDDADGTEYRVYDRSGTLVYADTCSKGGQLSEFVYLDTELVGRLDSECDAGCHS